MQFEAMQAHPFAMTMILSHGKYAALAGMKANA
jgi:hypothetical protein